MSNKIFQYNGFIKYHRLLLQTDLLRYNKVFVTSFNSTKITSNEDFRDFKIKNVSLYNYLKHLKQQYNNLLEKKEKTILKNHELETVVHLINQRNELIENISSLDELKNEKDESLKELAQVDFKEYLKNLQEVDQKLLSALMFTTSEDECNAIVLEVNSGVGGQEAMLFAKELFDMYCNFAKHKEWEVETADYDETDIGGIRHGSLLISGKSVFRYLKYEAGVHRVQRIPATEKGGRIHTSTVSVLALPQPTDIQINVQQKDLRIETKKASGAGGQHVNTTDSAVRITHIPTGISVECQVDRSQIKNKRIALTKLKTLLYQKEINIQVEQINATKKSQVRSNFRNEKIRTYNYSQDRITDHRVQGNIHNLETFLEGSNALDELIMRLDKESRLEKLLEAVNKVNKT